MTGPLKGINVLDLGLAVVGPWGACQLGALGANVVKVEPPEGDRVLANPPNMKGISVGYTFASMNKRSAKIDVKDPANRPYVDRLIAEADVLIENMKPGTADRLGVGYQRACGLNPRIVYVSGPAWGSYGTKRDLPGLDPTVGAASGFWSLNGEPGGPAENVRYWQMDVSGACYIAAAALLGLMAREATGQSQHIVVPNISSAISVQMTRVAEFFATGQEPQRLGSACASKVPDQAFRCLDNQYLAVSVETQTQWYALLRALELDGLAQDSRFATNMDRVEHRDQLVPKLEAAFLTRPARWWIIRLTREGVPHGRFMEFEELRQNVHVLENGHLVEMEMPAQGRVYLGGVPWRFSETPAGQTPAPYPGQHTEVIKRDGFGSSVKGNASILHPADRKAQRSPSDGVGSLNGLRVIDVTQGICGPYLSYLLAFAGADVIKVEPPTGDYARAFAPRYGDDDGAAFLLLNQKKRSVTLDLQTEQDREMLRQLLKGADIFLEDRGPGVADSLGLDYQSLKQQNPGLIYGAITPFGETGPYRDLPGSELVVQAMSGAWACTEETGHCPVRIGADIATINTAVMAFSGILSALFYRAHHGVGQRVSISVVGGMYYLMSTRWAAMTDPDDWVGFAAYRGRRGSGYRTGDGAVSWNLHRSTEEDVAALISELGNEEMLTDPRFAKGGRETVGRGRYTQEVFPIWERAFMRHSTAKVIEVIRKYGGMVEPVSAYREVFSDPQIELLNIARDVDYPPAGKVKVLVPPWECPGLERQEGPPPTLGQHTAEILLALGHSHQQISQLRKERGV